MQHDSRESNRDVMAADDDSRNASRCWRLSWLPRPPHQSVGRWDPALRAARRRCPAGPNLPAHIMR